MSNIIHFDFNSHAVRVIDDNGEPWFVAMDVAEVLDYSDAHKMTSKLDEDEKQNRQIRGSGFNPKGTILINEAGLYSCILTSQKPEAKPFKRWVTHEVLPAIRKTGVYSVRPAKSGGLEQFRKARAIEIAAKTAEGICNRFPHLGAQAQQTIYATLVNPIAGDNAVPLPMLESKTYSATEVGEMLGVTAHKVGLLANGHGLKVSEYGIWVLDKSRHSSKQVESFRYNDAAVLRLRELLASGADKNKGRGSPTLAMLIRGERP